MLHFPLKRNKQEGQNYETSSTISLLGGERPDAGSRDTYTLIQVGLGWNGSAISISFLPPPLCEVGNQGNLQCNVAEEENGGPTSPTPGAEIISLSRLRRVSPKYFKQGNLPQQKQLTTVNLALFLQVAWSHERKEGRTRFFDAPSPPLP